jgi:hypothetical protein
MALGNFRSKQDLENKKLKKQAYLQAQIDLNKQKAEAVKETIRNRELNIAPAPVQVRSVEEEEADKVLQRDKAFAVLKRILKPNDASNVLYELQENDELNDFNRFAEPFLKEIAGQTNLSKDRFTDLWDRYKLKLASSDETGIFIGPEKDEYSERLEKLMEDVEETKEGVEEVADVLTGLTTGPAGALMKQIKKEAVELAGLDARDLDQAFLRSFETVESKKPVVGDIVDIPNPRTKVFDKYKLDEAKKGKFVGRVLLVKLGLKSTKKDPANNEKIQYILYNDFKVPYGQVVTWTGDPISAKATNDPTALVKGTGISSLITPPSSDRLKPLNLKIGYGIMVEEKPMLAIDSHKHKRESRQNDEPNFGNYKLSLNALKKGFLHLRYPSGVSISHFPKRLITSKLRKIINDIMYEKSFNEDDYQELDEEEKQLFDNLLVACKADKKDCVLLYKHKKYNDKQRDEDINRFNLLRGQLIAGNDNELIIKELKGLMFKLMNEKVISRADYNKIMERILII